MKERTLINNQEICNQLDTLLIEKGYKTKSVFNTVQGYTQEELALLESVILECSESLEDLLKLPNLKILKIKSQNQETVIEKDPFQVNTIQDFSILSYLTNLEELTIVNDPNLQELDLTNLTKLKKIKLCNNLSLTTVKGLDQLTGLENILIYGNKKEPDIDPMRYLENTKSAKKNYLDITMFHDMKQKMANFEDVYLNYTASYATNLEFVEKVGIYNYYVPLRSSAVIQLYKEAENIVNGISFKLLLSSKDKMKSLYNYTKKKIKYDYETLDQRDTDSLTIASKDQQLSYNLSFPNTSYSALVNKKTVCEGYSNTLRLLYHMIGIESRVIYCSKPSEFINGLNHAALKVKYHDQSFYIDADPNWNKNDVEFFMIPKEEFEKTHVLSAIEQVKGSESNDVKRYIK